MNTKKYKKIVEKIKSKLFQSDYLIINILFFILLSLLFIYSFAFSSSGAYPIKSNCIQFPDLCISKGLSRAFSQILSGNFEKATQLNPYSLHIFLFFALQFLFRIVFFILYYLFPQKRIIKIDIILSFLLFAYTFSSFIIKLMNQLLY